jgi:hypothetical protein
LYNKTPYLYCIKPNEMTQHNTAHELVAKIADRVSQIDSRIFAKAEGAEIRGSFRGRDSYCYNVSSRSFIFNKAGGNVSSVFEQAVNELMSA